MQMFMFVSALATECLVLSNLLDYPYLKSKTALGTSVERMTTTVTACLPQAASIHLYSLWLKLLWSCVWMLWGKLVNKAAISTAVSDSQKAKHMPSNMEASGTSGFHHCKIFIPHVWQFCLALSPLISAFHALEEQCCWLICRSYLYLIKVGLMIPTFFTCCCSSKKRMTNSMTGHDISQTCICMNLQQAKLCCRHKQSPIPSDLGAPFQLSGPPSTSSTSFFFRSIDLLICR